MWLIVVATALACAHGQNVKTAHAGTKGGYGSNWGSQTHYGGGQPYSPPMSEVGVCYVEVPTASLVRDPAHVPPGNGSRSDLSRIRTCCSGYIKNIHNRFLCDPVCTEECINALCTAPETCTCFPDHVKNAAGFCIATCPIGCQNGHCAGGQCVCKDGYRLDSMGGKYCLPICRDNCNGLGNCTAPNTCSCRPGYQSTPDGSCRVAGQQPHGNCDKPCENGNCVGHNECRCKPGYTKDFYRGSCVPQCAQNCGPDASCVAPNTCMRTTTTSPGSYPYPPYNPSSSGQTNQYQPTNPHYNYSSNHPQSPDNLRPQYSPNGPYPGNTYYPNNQGSPYNISSDSQIKPSYPGNGGYYGSNSYGQMNSSSNSYNPSIYQTNLYNASNPNQNPTGNYYPFIPDSTVVGDPTNPNQPGYYPGNHPGQAQPGYPGSPYQQGQNQPGYPGQNQSNQPNSPYPYQPGQSNLYPILPNNPGQSNLYYPNQPGQNSSHPVQPSYQGEPNQSNLYNPNYPGPYYPYQPNSTHPGANLYQPGYPNQQYQGQSNFYPNQQGSTYPGASSNQQGYYPNQSYPGQSYPNQPVNSSYYQPNNQGPHRYPDSDSDSDSDSKEDIGLPQCSKPCLNGVCVLNNGYQCKCNHGYILDAADSSKCNPHCPGGCQNGVCSAPNFCICNMGYRKEQGVKGRAGCVKRLRRSVQP